jgi:sugar phosphate permease
MTAVGVPGRAPALARRIAARHFYGWVVAVSCLAMMFVTVGVGYYGQSVFLKPLKLEHGWSSSVVNAASGLYFGLSGIAGFVVGRHIDRRGAVPFLAFGIVATGFAVAGLGLVEHEWQLFVVYAAMAVAYGVGAALPISSMLSRWFIRSRAKATSISSTGVSLGGAILVPVGTALIEAHGLATAAPILGALVIVVALPVLLLAVVPDPALVGQQPDGGPAKAEAAPARRMGDQYRVWTRNDAMRTTSFWALLIGFTLALAAQTAVLINQQTFLSDSDKLGSLSAAALAVTTTTVGSIVARLAMGQIADGLDKRWVTVGLFALQGLAIALYTIAGSTWSIYLVATVFGFTIGNVYMMQSLLVGELFGITSFATVYSVIALAGQLGSAAGMFFIGWARDASGGYTMPFLVLAGVNLTAAVVVSRARPLD